MVWLLLACTGPTDPDPDSPDEHGAAIECAGEGVDGFDRFSEEDAARGFTETIPDLREEFDNPDARFGSGIAAGDIDGDGDIDIIAGRAVLPTMLYLNDGTGHFSRGDDLPGVPDTTLGDFFGGDGISMQFALADMDGDGLPELLATGFGFLAVYPNLGSGDFGTPILAHNDGKLLGMFLGIAVGDMDGDEDLDVSIISNVGLNFSPGCEGKCESFTWPDLLIENLGDLQFAEATPLYSAPEGSHAMLGVFTDRDQDGDADLMVLKDYWGENAFWRNDGPGEWVDDDAKIGADFPWSAMGADVLDLNGDGWLDYCVTDTGPVRCLLSNDADTYVEGAASLGLIADSEADTVGWSIYFSDLDNDGWTDAAYAGAPMGNQQGVVIEEVPDVMFGGQPGGTFTDVSGVAGFDDQADHYGMIQADLDGDGFLEIVMTGPGKPLRFVDNACNDNHWLALDFEGPGLNTDGWGATVIVEAGGRRWMQELTASPGPGHSPPRVHVGLGDIDVVDSVEVSWPGGARAAATDLPTRRLITLTAD